MAGPRSDDLTQSPWWPEFLEQKGSVAWSRLASKYGVTMAALKKALDDYSPITRVLSAEAGRKPDAEVAARAGVTPEAVKEYRREHGIAPFLRPPPVAQPRVEEKTVANNTGRAVVRRRDGGQTETVRHEAPAPKGSPLDAYRDRMGKVPDQEIAEAAGVARTAVGDYRRKLGIPAYEGFRYKKGGGRESDAPAPVEAKPRGRPGPRSTIDAYADLLGKVPDSEVAGMAGVTVGAVHQYRSRRGIGPYTPPAAPPPEPERAPAAAGFRGRTSKIDPFVKLVGVEPDSVVAEKAGVTAENVRAWRVRRGIPGPVARTPVERAQAPEPAAVKAPKAQAPVVEAPKAPAPVVEAPKAPAPVVEAPKAPAPVVEAPKAPAPVVEAPKVRAPAAKSATVWAYAVTGVSGTDSKRFVVVGADIADAAARARDALSRRGGGWRVTSVREVVEALQ